MEVEATLGKQIKREWWKVTWSCPVCGLSKCNHESEAMIWDMNESTLHEAKKKRGFKRKLIFVSKAAVLVFAFIGFTLTAGFFAVKFKLTNVAGSIDLNDRYFQSLPRKQALTATHNESDGVDFIHYKLAVLGGYYPQNAKMISEAFGQHKDVDRAEKMFQAIDLYLKDNKDYQTKIKQFDKIKNPVPSVTNGSNLFTWIDTEEWQTLKAGVQRDKAVILRAAKDSGLDARTIVTMMMGEQMRLFFAQREIFKKYFAPLKILGNETKFSLGVGGVKDETGQVIEMGLKKKTSPYYLGEQYEHLLDYPNDPAAGTLSEQRFKRLTEKSHYYGYLYTALFGRQIIQQWKNAGFDISDRPEILATLFNIGYAHSKPNASPQVGGTQILIKDRKYTFGSLAFEFYHSGELLEEFPFPASAKKVQPVPGNSPKTASPEGAKTVVAQL